MGETPTVSAGDPGAQVLKVSCRCGYRACAGMPMPMSLADFAARCAAMTACPRCGEALLLGWPKEATDG